MYIIAGLQVGHSKAGSSDSWSFQLELCIATQHARFLTLLTTFVHLLLHQLTYTLPPAIFPLQFPLGCTNYILAGGRCKDVELTLYEARLTCPRRSVFPG